jgi:hypothetical protein
MGRSQITTDRAIPSRAARLPTHKVVITGTGRSGSTLLVRLLTECGLDTGFTTNSWRGDYHEHCHAGLERDILAPDAPYIVKNPNLCEALPEILASGQFVIDHAFIPMRDLDSATQSRLRIGGAFNSVPGGLWNTDEPGGQKAILAELYHDLMLTLCAHEIPFTLLEFPRLSRDADYTYAKLGSLVRDVPRPKFRRIFERVADPRLVHTFDPLAPLPAHPATNGPALAYAATQRQYSRQRRHRRLVKRIAAGALAALLLADLIRMRVQSLTQPGSFDALRQGSALASHP